MGRQYRHLNEVDRQKMEALLAAGHTQKFVADTLGFSPSTISREVRRGVVPGWHRYTALFGQRTRLARRKRAGAARRKLGFDVATPLWRSVLAGLRKGWSPQQVAGRLRRMNSSQCVSHETIYGAIYAQPRGTLRTELIKLLRKSPSGRRNRARGDTRYTGVQKMTPIELRPPEIAARTAPGHWEGDLIKGARNASAVGTLVERKSRFVMLVKLDNAGAETVLEGFTKRLRKIPESLRRTMTYDQGSEMALHDTLAKRLHMDIYFCDPHSPWQRGTNENANGLIREYLPKGMDLNLATQRELTAIEHALNGRPRKILGFRTPEEVFSELTIGDIAGVALQA